MNDVNVSDLLAMENVTAKSTLAENVDSFFILVVSMIIFFMQCGFAFLEAGSVRSKNTTNILLKNLLDSAVGAISYWAFGYAFAFGEGGKFIGLSGFFGTFPEEKLPNWFFQMVFAATAATIVSGGVAERCEFGAYLVYSLMISGFCYPVITRWAWYQSEISSGWLRDQQSVIEGAAYQDFAGSGVVHLCGGVAALIAAVVLGPRLGRFESENGIHGHSVPLTALGGFVLMFGFLAFNGGSKLAISGSEDAVAVARAIANTMISGSAAGVVAMLIHRVISAKKCNCLRYSTWSLLTAINGVLTGMVSICAGADKLDMWGAFITGAFSGIIYSASKSLLTRLKVDDPLDATAVHGFGGTWGLISAPFLDAKAGIIVTGSLTSLQTLALNIVGWLAIVSWTSLICVPMFVLLKKTGTFRVDPSIEIKGLDIPKHAEPAYPAEAWGDGWGDFLQPTGVGLVSVSPKPALTRRQQLNCATKPVSVVQIPEENILDP